MNTTISSNGLPKLPLATTSADTGASQSAGGAATSGASASSAPDDSVKLTDSARALQQASSTGSPVDTARVDQIRQALANGTYKIDANAIAGKLTSMESQIGGK